MRCRRGATRGRLASERPSSSHGDALSTEHTERWNTQDSRQQWDQDSPPGFAQDHQPSSHPPSDIPPPACTGPRPSGSHILRQTSQRAELRFDCAFDQPTITAYITITLREESTLQPPPLHAPPPISTDLNTPLASDIPIPGQVPLQVEANLSGTDGVHMEATEDAEEQYGCRIEEEQPSPTHTHLLSLP